MSRRADVADLNQITGMLDAVRATGTRVAGVFHAAGILDDGILLQLEGERFAGAMRPKVQGAWNLHTATRDDRLDHFVLFSAATSMFGSAGQATHAAANAFLDACAAHRKAAGLPALSVNWGAWSRVGAASGAAVAARVRMKGLRPIEPAQGLEILERLMQGDTAQVGVFGVDWDAIPAAMAALPFLAACRPRTASVAVEPMATPASAAGAAALAATLETTAAHRRRPLVAAHVRDEVRRILALGDSAPLDMRQGFFDLGFDSLTSMELRNRLQSTCGCSLPATLVFDYPTPEALVDRLMALMSPEAAAPAAARAATGQDEVADLLTHKLAELRESLGS
jgi:acyl carrier protein